MIVFNYKIIDYVIFIVDINIGHIQNIHSTDEANMINQKQNVNSSINLTPTNILGIHLGQSFPEKRNSK